MQGCAQDYNSVMQQVWYIHYVMTMNAEFNLLQAKYDTIFPSKNGYFWYSFAVEQWIISPFWYLTIA